MVHHRLNLTSVLGSFCVPRVVIVFHIHGDVMEKRTVHQERMKGSVQPASVQEVMSDAQIPVSVFPVSGCVTEVMTVETAWTKWTVLNDRVKRTNSSAAMEYAFPTSWSVTVILTVLVLMERMNFHPPVNDTAHPNHPDSFATLPTLASGTSTSATVLMTVPMDQMNQSHYVTDGERINLLHSVSRDKMFHQTVSEAEILPKKVEG